MCLTYDIIADTLNRVFCDLVETATRRPTLGQTFSTKISLIELSYLLSLRMLTAYHSILYEYYIKHKSFLKLFIFSQNKREGEIPFSNLLYIEQYVKSYANILVTTPDATVLPPSRTANLNPISIAIGVINSIVNFALSPGITISTPSSNAIVPVTSVVLK